MANTKKSTSSSRKSGYKKTTGSKKTGSTKKAGARNSYSKKSTNAGANAVKHSDIATEISILVVIALTLLLFIGNLGVKAVVVHGLAYVFFGLFGVMEYVFPILVFVLFWIMLANAGNKKVRNKIIFIGVLFILICAIIQLFCGYSNDYFYYFTHCAGYQAEGGFVGALIAKTLGELVGGVGAAIILFIAVLIMLCLITGKTFIMNLIGKIRETGAEAYEIASSDDNEDYEYVDLNKNDNLNQNTKKRKSLRNDGSTLFQNITGLNKDNASERGQLDKNKVSLKKPVRVNKPLLDEKDITDDEINNVLDAQTRDIIDKQDEKVTREDTKNETKTLASQIQNDTRVYKNYKLPPLSLLRRGSGNSSNDSDARNQAAKLNMILSSFGVNAKVVGFTKGPSVTQFEVQPDIGVKVKKISDLADDIKLGLAVPDIRIEAPIPGKSVVGIEVPNGSSTGVMLRDLLESPKFQNAKSKISFAVGRNIQGEVVVSDIAKLPHLLIGGSTGSGKSVFMNTLIMSILYKASPDEVKFFMIDPKMIELSVYNKLPHLVVPVVTDPKKAAGVLNYAVVEMTKRYKLFSLFNVKNLEEYNEKIQTLPQNEDKTAYVYEGETYKKKPQIVIVVDEFADLMMVAKGEVEESVCRLAQLARAAGIHLILATQRPSVDVITGLIKANMPSRCALLVSSGVDSRTIIDQVGAEKLLGNGDMLYSPSGTSHPVRIQGSYVSGSEVESVVNAIIKQNGELKVDESTEQEINTAMNSGSITGGAVSINSGESIGHDEFFVDAGVLLIEKQKASVGMLQRQFRIGFNRAARIMDELHECGVVSEEEGTKPRKVLMTSVEEFKNKIEEE